MSTKGEGGIDAQINDRPKYVKVSRSPRGAIDGKGRLVYCQTHEDQRAVWTGLRRPTARIMVRPFAFCDECWKKERLR